MRKEKLKTLLTGTFHYFDDLISKENFIMIMYSIKYQKLCKGVWRGPAAGQVSPGQVFMTVEQIVLYLGQMMSVHSKR